MNFGDDGFHGKENTHRAEVIPDLTTISASQVIGDMVADPAAIVTCPTD